MQGIARQMIFSPQRCLLQRLDDTLTSSRRKLAEQLLENYGGSTTNTGSHHVLLLGARGSGKSHVLSFVAKTLEAAGSSSGPRVIMLPEEERGISRPLDFVLSILRAAGVAQAELRSRIQAASTGEQLGEAISLLDKTLGKKPTLIVTENMDDILSALGDEGMPIVRAFFQQHATISLLSSSTGLWDDSDRPDNPFYGFFEIIPLKELSRDEARQHLKALAKADGDLELHAALGKPVGRARVDAIYHLTGGNPRLLSMLRGFLTAENLDNLVDPFVEMADRELTPYYQQRMDRLSPTQNRVVQALAAAERPLMVSDIADYVFMQQQVTSRALADLMQWAMVKRHARGREAYYELREPLLRLVLDLKIAGEGPIRLIVSFLRKWYSRDELERLETVSGEIAKQYIKAALSFSQGFAAQEQISKSIEAALGMSANEVNASLRSMDNLDAGIVALKFEQWVGAVQACDKVLEETAKVDDFIVAAAMWCKAMALGRMGKFSEASNLINILESRFSSNSDERVRSFSMLSIWLNAGLLAKQGHDGAALGELDRFLGCSFRYESSVLTPFATMSLVARAQILYRMGKFEEALISYNEALARVDVVNDANSMHIAVCLGRNLVLIKLGRIDEAIEEFDVVLKNLNHKRQDSLGGAFLGALCDIPGALVEAGRLEDALAACDKALRCLSEIGGDADLVARTAFLSSTRSLILCGIGRESEEYESHEKQVRHFDGVKDRTAEYTVALAYARLVAINLERGRLDLAVMYNEKVQLPRKNFFQAASRIAAGLATHRKDEALELLQEFIDSTQPNTSERVKTVQFSLPFIVADSSVLGAFVAHFNADFESLSTGTLNWIRAQLPLTEESARRLDSAEANLLAAVAGVEEMQIPLAILHAARLHAMGDTKALLELPLEVRRLIEPAAGQEADEL